MREPIFWTAPTPGFNKRDRERVRWLNGKQIVERIPQGPHDGSSSYDDPRRLPNQRFAHVLKHCGTEARIVLTNAASHTDISTGYAQQQRMKARTLGWFDIGVCPLLLVVSGQIDSNKLVERSFFAPDSNDLIEQPCPPGVHGADKPCPHYLLERSARRAVQRELMASKESPDTADKLLRAVSALVEGQQAQAEVQLAQLRAHEPLLSAPITVEPPPIVEPTAPKSRKEPKEP